MVRIGKVLLRVKAGCCGYTICISYNDYGPYCFG
jgi:hypothetical protein